MPPKGKPTRGKTSQNYGGVFADLPTTVLPTYGDVARCYYFVRNAEKHKPTQIKIIQDKIENVWQQCNPALPLMQKKSLTRKLTLFITRVKDFDIKNLKAAAKKPLLAVKEKLFDISACTCQLPILECKSKLVFCNAEEGTCNKIHINCECAPEKRVPVEEREYLRDQRMKTGTFGGRFQFGGRDLAAVQREERREHREESHARLRHNESIRLEENVQMEMSFGSEVNIL